MPILVRFASTLPSNLDPKSLRIVIGGGSKANTGTIDYQNRANQSTMSEAGLSTNISTEFPVNGIVISRIPYTFPDSKIITSAPFTTKEQLARFVEALYIDVVQDGVILTPAQIRAL